MVNVIKKTHSICKKTKSELNPIIELNVIISKEVATACLIVNRANKTNAGTIIKPPPAPTKPVRSPTPKPINTNIKQLIDFQKIPLIPIINEYHQPII